MPFGDEWALTKGRWWTRMYAGLVQRQLWNLLADDVHPPSYGLFMTGVTNPNLRPEDRAGHRMAVHRAPLP